MKTTLTLLAAASMAAIAAPAAAQDSEAGGAWVGVIGGYDISKAGSSVDNDGNEDDDQSMPSMQIPKPRSMSKAATLKTSALVASALAATSTSAPGSAPCCRPMR